VVICLERDADLHMAQLMPMPLTVCFSKIQVGFTFLVPAHTASPGQRAVKRVCVCMRACVRASEQASVRACVCSCQKWVHKKCSGIKGSMSKVAKSFICSGC